MFTNLRPFRQVIAAIALVAAGALPACAASSIARLDPARIDALTRISAATRGDCIAAVAAMVMGRSAPADDPVLLDRLVELEILRPKETRNLHAAATRGYACLLFKRAMNESASVWATLMFNSEHYAYQHLAHLKLIPDGSSWVAITGPELLTLLSRAKSYGKGAK